MLVNSYPFSETRVHKCPKSRSSVCSVLQLFVHHQLIGLFVNFCRILCSLFNVSWVLLKSINQKSVTQPPFQTTYSYISDALEKAFIFLRQILNYGSCISGWIFSWTFIIRFEQLNFTRWTYIINWILCNRYELKLRLRTVTHGIDFILNYSNHWQIIDATKIILGTNMRHFQKKFKRYVHTHRN